MMLVFVNYFAGTPVRRAGYDRFMRNILIAAGNSDDAALVPSFAFILIIMQQW